MKKKTPQSFYVLIPLAQSLPVLVSNRIIDASDFKRAQVETDAAGSLDFDSILKRVLISLSLSLSLETGPWDLKKESPQTSHV